MNNINLWLELELQRIVQKVPSSRCIKKNERSLLTKCLKFIIIIVVVVRIDLSKEYLSIYFNPFEVLFVSCHFVFQLQFFRSLFVIERDISSRKRDYATHRFIIRM